MKMELETIEKGQIEQGGFKVSDQLSELHKGFESSLSPENGVFATLDMPVLDESIRDSFGIGQIEVTPEIRTAVVNTVRDMYYGTRIDDRQSLGLKEINQWKINENYRESNISQHAGYAAEVISTNKENFMARLNGTGEQVFRADDLPKDLLDQFDGKIAAKNDQYVDKVRIKSDGTYETVQTKFVGKNADECFKKLMSKKFDKYLEEGKVDKIEIPKEYYDDVKELIRTQKKDLCEQYAHVSSESGKSEVASNVKGRIEKLDKLNKKLEQSIVTKEEAKFAVEHPKRYAAKQINNTGLKSGAEAALSAAALSGVQNMQAYMASEVTLKEAGENVAKVAVSTGAVAYGTEVLSQVADGSSIPSVAARIGLDSLDDVQDYIEGDITKSELVYNIGENTFAAVGGAIGDKFAGEMGEEIGRAAGRKVYQEETEFVTENKETIIKATENIGQKASEIADGVKGTAGDIKDAAADKLDAAADKASEIKDAAADKLDAAADKASENKDAAADKLDAAADKAGELKDAAVSKITNLFGKD